MIADIFSILMALFILVMLTMAMTAQPEDPDAYKERDID